ncbi:MAG: hypothetical protein OCC49_07380 [Fibrobacterales bacterium]
MRIQLPSLLLKTLLLTYPLLVLGCAETAMSTDTSQSTDSSLIRTLNYTYIGSKIFPLEHSGNYTYNFLQYDTEGNKVDSTTKFKLEISSYSAGPDDSFLFHMPGDEADILQWKGEDYSADERGIYIIGRYDTKKKREISTEADPIFWLPQSPEKGVRTLGSDYTIEYLGNDFSYIMSVDNCSRPVLEEAMLFKEEAGDFTNYYYIKKGVGILGWEKYYKGILTDMAVLNNMNFKTDDEDDYYAPNSCYEDNYYND